MRHRTPPEPDGALAIPRTELSHEEGGCGVCRSGDPSPLTRLSVRMCFREPSERWYFVTCTAAAGRVTHRRPQRSSPWSSRVSVGVARAGRGPPRGGSGTRKTCRFFRVPRAVPRRRRRSPSTPPAIAPSYRARRAPQDGEGAASKAVRVLILGGTPVGAFAPPSTSHVI